MHVKITKRGDRVEVDSQRHLAPGAHVRSTPAGWTPRRRSASRSSSCSTRRRRSPRRLPRHRHRPAGGHGGQRAAARRRDLPVLGAEPGDALARCCARSAEARRRRRRSPATAARTTSTTPTACTRTGRRGCRRRRLGGELGPCGATAARRRRHLDGVLPGQRHRGAVEAIEADVPAVVLREEQVPDTAGPGFNRGGPR